MKNIALAVVVSFSVGFAVSAFARPVPAKPAELSCKAAGQACSDKEECCSRMCRKDNHKCS